MSAPIICGIFLEIVIVVWGVYFIKKLKEKQTRQPSLSNKIVKNLKF
tara:strand:+ start:1601 stop:1741 length:141 start_codon:yes stop_codon:yes gene_type:complete